MGVSQPDQEQLLLVVPLVSHAFGTCHPKVVYLRYAQSSRVASYLSPKGRQQRIVEVPSSRLIGSKAPQRPDMLSTARLFAIPGAVTVWVGEGADRRMTDVH